MKIGRNFTNLLSYQYLSNDNKEKFKQETISVADMDALVQGEAKRDIVTQLNTAKNIHLDHIELDGAVPNPYLDMTIQETEKIKKLSQDLNISISVHLPYTFVAESICSFSRTDRYYAVELLKKYLDFCSDINACYANLHPGSVPFYLADKQYLNDAKHGLIDSLTSLAKYAETKNVVLLMENNTAFDNIFYDIDICLDIVETVRKESNNIFFNFDIGHWFTRANIDIDLPEPPVRIMESFSSGIMKETHLNDYIPKIKKFHPPLHLEQGLMKRNDLIYYFKKCKELNIETVVMETALRENKDIINAEQIMKDEIDYIRSILEDADI